MHIYIHRIHMNQAECDACICNPTWEAKVQEFKAHLGYKARHHLIKERWGSSKVDLLLKVRAVVSLQHEF